MEVSLKMSHFIWVRFLNRRSRAEVEKLYCMQKKQCEEMKKNIELLRNGKNSATAGAQKVRER